MASSVSIKSRPSMRGAKNPRWNGGVSEYPNHYLFKKSRLVILKQVNYRCGCGKKAALVHHINKNKSDHSLENLEAVCIECHHQRHCSLSHPHPAPHKSERHTSKYVRLYGKTLKELAKERGVSTTKVWLELQQNEQNQD